MHSVSCSILLPHQHFLRSTMSAPAAKQARPRPGSRVTLRFTFENDAASSVFKARFERVKSLLAPVGRQRRQRGGADQAA